MTSSSQISPQVAVATAVVAATTAGLVLYLTKSKNNGKTRRAAMSCACGRVQVQLYQPAANYRYIETPSFQCACADCVGVCEKVLDAGTSNKTFNESPPFFTPGVHNYILYDSEILVTHGTEMLQSMKLSNKSPNRRVYSKCCGTPMGISFESIPLSSVFTRIIHKADLKVDGSEVDFPFLEPYCCVYADAADPERQAEPKSMVLCQGKFAPKLIGRCLARIAFLAGFGARGPGKGFPMVGEMQIGLDSIRVDKGSSE